MHLHFKESGYGSMGNVCHPKYMAYRELCLAARAIRRGNHSVEAHARLRAALLMADNAMFEADVKSRKRSRDSEYEPSDSSTSSDCDSNCDSDYDGSDCASEYGSDDDDSEEDD